MCCKLVFDVDAGDEIRLNVQGLCCSLREGRAPSSQEQNQTQSAKVTRCLIGLHLAIELEDGTGFHIM